MKWSRGDATVQVEDVMIHLPAPLLWLEELPAGNILVTTLFDEDTPCNQTNVYVYDSNGNMKSEIRVNENNHLVRFLGSELKDGTITLLGANDTKYTLNPNDFTVTESGYYR